MKRIATAVSALILSASAALAGSVTPPPVDPPVTPPATVGTDWTGFRIGAQLGYADVGFSGTAAADGNGLIGGVHAGYDYDFGTLVLGAEVDYDAADFDLTGPGGPHSFDNIGRLKLRAGADTGRALVYGTAGLARAQATSGGVSRTGDGYFFGMGVDFMASSRATIGAELLQNEFDDFDNTGLDISATTVTLRASFRF